MQIGELQCYDRRALASLAQAAQEKGHPEWGYTGPHDAGTYTSNPEVTLLFRALCQATHTVSFSHLEIVSRHTGTA